MAELTAGSWNYDSAHSEVGFTVRHAGITKVRGTFEQVDAQLTIAENIADSTIKAVAQIASVNTNNADRDGHLRSPEFFDADTHAEMTFESTSFKLEGEDLTVAGNLTIKGETQPVTFAGEFTGAVVDAFGVTRAGASLTATISRKDFGITWNAAIEAGGVLVSDKVVINLDVAFTAPEA
ncbi:MULTISPECIES: YceI family protein [Rothia]|uniref:Polyisoprenoid-binding protein n=1 Tax=Rothia nasimurium TaxID=85336 RepID=A0A1Y1RNY6_9MICC|nr:MULTISPECIES: YceI family protein [Rothia]ORC15916.1 polyisoprenoid-binding protein [Rothia nasimurium]